VRQLLRLTVAACLSALVAAADTATAAPSALELPVPKVTIYPGDVIAEDLIVERAFVASTVSRSTVFDARQALIGKVARRTLLPGQPVPVNAIRDPYAVVQGKAVLVIFEAGGLTITSQAMPLQSGVIGETISLRNMDSGAIFKGTVEANGSIRVSMP
jgi:flagella basal body P-ring formation protein FlgA